MADISKIRIPDGTEYDLKDATAREQIAEVNASLLTSDGKVAILACMHKVAWLSNEDAFLAIVENAVLDDKALITPIYMDDFIRGGVWRHNSYPWWNANSVTNRIICKDISIIGNHAYRVKMFLVENVSVKMFLNLYNKNVADAYINESGITSNDHIDILQGWGGDGILEHIFVAPNTINSSPASGLVIGVAKVDNSDFDNSVVGFCVVEDVTDTIIYNRDTSGSVIISGNELVQGEPWNSYNYPYYEVGDRRIIYFNLDLFVEGGKNYLVKAYAFQQDTPIQMFINAYNETFFEAAENKEHVSSSDYVDVLGGWSEEDDLEHTITIPQTINGSPAKGIIMGFKHKDNVTISVGDVTYIKIQEVE